VSFDIGRLRGTNMSSSSLPIHNNLLQQLSRQQRTRIIDACEPVELHFGDSLCAAGHPFVHVYFPLNAFISLVAGVSRHPPLEIGMIGSEGMLGSTLVLGVKTSPLQAIVQRTGSALRMPVKRFFTALLDNSELRPVLGRYQYVLLRQMSQTAACTRFHELGTRLVRWLLMTNDRANADTFYLTHQFLADMLGVQRSAVTIAAGALQRQGLIRYTRGEITILDRQGLEALACECYRVIVDDYQQTFASHCTTRLSAASAHPLASDFS